MSIANRLLSLYPDLKKQVNMARYHLPPDQIIARGIKNGLTLGGGFTVLAFFVVDKSDLSYGILPVVFFISALFFFKFEQLKVTSAIGKRKKEIDQEVLFIGRYLLIKLYSGRPLLNALIETSKGRGIAAAYIGELVHDINTGTMIEDAIKKSIEYSPSKRLSKILFQVNNALKVGIDVTRPLESVLKELTLEEELEIKKYGKKLNTIVIFYMVVAIIMPSLGIAMFMSLANFINIAISLTGLLIVLFFIGVLQFVFIAIFSAIRPKVNF